MAEFIYFISCPIKDFWNKETLNCLKSSNLKGGFAGNGKERLFIFVQREVCENSWHTVRFKMIFSSKTHLVPKSHQGNKAHWTQRKAEIADKIFSKMDVLCK